MSSTICTWRSSFINSFNSFTHHFIYIDIAQVFFFKLLLIFVFPRFWRNSKPCKITIHFIIIVFEIRTICKFSHCIFKFIRVSCPIYFTVMPFTCPSMSISFARFFFDIISAFKKISNFFYLFIIVNFRITWSFNLFNFSIIANFDSCFWIIKFISQRINSTMSSLYLSSI